MNKAVFAALSILALVILFITVLFVAELLFNRNVKREVRNLFDNNVEGTGGIIREADLEGLPSIVQNWLKQSNVIGKERIKTVRLKQNAQMRLNEEGPWMSAKAEQYFTIEQPGFIWKVKVMMNPFLYFTGRDKYNEGKGHMLIKVLSLFNAADASGKEIDQGTMLRYLAESVWFPTAALSNYIKWEETGDNFAVATMSYGGVTASGVFRFNEKGKVTGFEAERYGEFDGEYRLETWEVKMTGYKEFNGIKIPNKGEVIWKLDTGDYNWFRFEIKEIDYNKAEVY